MDTKKENLILIGIVIFVVTVLAFIYLQPMQPASSIKAAAPVKLRGIKVAPEGKPQPGLQEKRVAAAADILSRWGRDPFEYRWADEGAPEPAARERRAPAKEPLSVSLIIISDTDRTATINGRLYKEGDTVRGNRIVAIKQNSVVLKKNNERSVLPLRKSTVNIRSHTQHSGR